MQLCKEKHPVDGAQYPRRLDYPLLGRANIMKEVLIILCAKVRYINILARNLPLISTQIGSVC